MPPSPLICSSDIHYFVTIGSNWHRVGGLEVDDVHLGSARYRAQSVGPEVGQKVHSSQQTKGDRKRCVCIIKRKQKSGIAEGGLVIFAPARAAMTNDDVIY